MHEGCDSLVVDLYYSLLRPSWIGFRKGSKYKCFSCWCGLPERRPSWPLEFLPRPSHSNSLLETQLHLNTQCRNTMELRRCCCQHCTAVEAVEVSHDGRHGGNDVRNSRQGTQPRPPITAQGPQHQFSEATG